MGTLHPVTIDAVIPARDEAPTVAAVVEVCRGCSYVREVIVVDDESTDETADLALVAGAEVGSRETWRMFWLLVGLPLRGVVRWRTYCFSLQRLTVER